MDQIADENAIDCEDNQVALVTLEGGSHACILDKWRAADRLIEGHPPLSRAEQHAACSQVTLKLLANFLQEGKSMWPKHQLENIAHIRVQYSNVDF